MKIIEKDVVPKKSVESCEDLIIITDDYIAIIDGATDVTGWRSDKGEPGGRVIPKIVEAAFTKIPSHSNAFEVINFITKQISEEWEQQENKGFPVPKNKPTASITIYSKNRNEIWQVGDVGFRTLTEKSEALAISDGQPEKLIERLYTEVRKNFIENLLDSGLTEQQALNRDEINDPHWDIIRTEFVFVNNENSEFGYAVLNGEPVPEKFIKVFKVPNDTKQIVIATDGYTFIGVTLHLTKDYLNAALQRDPLCIKELKQAKSVKKGNVSFDDSSYIRFEI